MEHEEIMSLWDRFETSKATRLEIEKDDFRFCLRKEEHRTIVMPSTGNTVSGAVLDHSSPVDSQVEATPDNAILAPLAGTFYRAPSPEAKEFVEVGQMVHKGDVIGIIEAMKLYNEVQADKDGVIKEILAQNGQLVEYHQPLMTIG